MIVKQAKTRILGINGSATESSSNQRILDLLSELFPAPFELDIWDDLSVLPHFKTELTDVNTPAVVREFREAITQAQGVIICTPEYVFSIPSRLKNAIEWCVSTTVFTDKPTGIITASASGKKGHEELMMIMRTVQAVFTDETVLLIPGVRGKLDASGNIAQPTTRSEVEKFSRAFIDLVKDGTETVS